MSFLASILDKLFPGSCREGHFSCPCGAVQADLRVPASSHLLLEQTNALCHCKDCVGFVQACPNGTLLMENNATHLVQFYKSDMTITKGQDKIQSVRLYPNSPMVRTYCQDCGTPLGADIPPGPVTLLYTKLIQTGPIFLPPVVLGFASALPGTRPYGRETRVRQSNMDIWFLFKVTGRVLLGFVLGKNHGGFLQLQYENVPIGLDAIKTIKKDK